MSGIHHMLLGGSKRKIAFIPAQNSDRLVAVSIDDPTNMSIIGSIYNATTLNGARTVQISPDKTRALVVCSGSYLTAVDITNPAGMSVVGTPLNDGDVSGSSYVDVDWDNGLAIAAEDNDFAGRVSSFDISDLTSIAKINRVTFPNDISNNARSTAIDSASSKAFTAGIDGIVVANINGAGEVSNGGTVYEWTDGPAEFIALDLPNDRAYVATRSGSNFQSFDISDRDSWSRLDTENTGDATLGIALDVSRGYAFVTDDSGNRLRAVNISNPSSLSIDGDIVLGSRPRGVKLDLQRNIAFVTCDNADALYAVDISTPSSMSVLGTLTDGTLLNAPYYLDLLL